MATPFPATSHSSPVSNPLASSGGGPGRSCLVLRSTTCARTFAEPAAAHHTVGGPWASPRCAVAPRVPPLLVNVHAWSCCAAATNQQPELNAPAWHELSPAQDTSNRTHINRFSATGSKNESFAAGVRRSGNTQIAMFQVIVS